jgi:hypothetical protein
MPLMVVWTCSAVAAAVEITKSSSRSALYRNSRNIEPPAFCLRPLIALVYHFLFIVKIL